MINHKFAVILILLLFGAGCSAVGTSVVSENRIVLMELCRQNSLSCYWDDVSQVVTITKNKDKAKALIESNIVVYGKEDIYLSSPIIKIRDTIYVPFDFQDKVVDRLGVVEKHKRAKLARRYKIIIDAGHGGKDPGASGRSGSQEKWIVLDISKKLNQLLKEWGYKTVMTRTKDTFLTLEERTEIASRGQADLFVSIHANSNPKRGVNGVEVYTLRKLKSSEKKEEQRTINRKLMFNGLDMKKNNPTLERMLSDMLFESKNKESKIAASYMAKEISSRTRVKNLGVKEAGFYVLRNTLIPAVLVEVGYLSNYREEKLLKNASHRQLVAEALATSINKYFK